MKKIFISADIEGTTGIAHWDETDRDKAHDYDYFADQMSREVAAACEGAHAAGAEEVLVKDAHSSGRNITPRKLPEYARMFRGWGRHPFSMMYGLDKSFDGVVFTGYHSAAQMPCNPLSHTMNTRNNYVKINGELASELMINSLTASYVGVPVYCVCGDKGLCEWVQTKNPNISVVPTIEGHGSGTFSMHPDVAVRTIRKTVEEAIANHKAEDCMFPMPKHFVAEINFKEHLYATSGGFYPGAEQVDARTIKFETDDWFDALRFFSFVM